MRILTIKTAASNLALLTNEELKTALGIASGDTSRDTDLSRLALRVSSAITGACNIRSDGLTPPTLLRETLVDTYYNRGGFGFWPHPSAVDAEESGRLILSRRRVASVTSVKFDDTVIDAAQYILDGPSGIVSWDCLLWPVGFLRTITVEYLCGFSTIPDDLKLAAETFARALWRDSYNAPGTVRDPLLRRDEVEGVGVKEFWVDPDREREMPPEVLSMLEDGGYVEQVIG